MGDCTATVVSRRDCRVNGITESDIDKTEAAWGV